MYKFWNHIKVDNPVIFYLDGKKWIPLAANSALSSNTEPRLKWTARVTNQDGEDAYNAGFTTKLPVFFKLNRFEIEPGNGISNWQIRDKILSHYKSHGRKVKPVKARENFDCTEFTTMSHNYIKCNVDNPFRANSQATVRYSQEYVLEDFSLHEPKLAHFETKCLFQPLSWSYLQHLIVSKRW